MPITPDPPFPKTQGDNIRSKDWNDAVNEVIRLDNAKTDRSGDHFTGPLTIDGNVSIGTVGPVEPLEVNGRIKSGALTIGPWPANPGNYVFFGTNALDQAVAGNYALLQSGGGGDQGVTYLNSPQSIHLRIGNSDRLTIDNAGNVGIGTLAPAEPLEVNGRIKTGALTIGPWPAGPDYAFFGTNSLNQAVAGNYALLQSGAGGDQGVTYLNSPQSIHLRIGNSDRLTIDNAGNVDLSAELRIPKTGDGSAAFTNQHFDNETGFHSNNLKLRMASIGLVFPIVPYEFAIGHSVSSFLGNNFVKRFSITENGDLFCAGSKAGYIVDYFVNRVGDTLEQGDVVVIDDNEETRFYGTNDDIPIPEVDLTDQPYDRRVCGIVARFVTEADLPSVDFKPITEEEAARLKQSSLENPLLPLAAKAGAETDHTRVADGQLGKMATLGAFAHCKVDADIAPIEAGDLLTTSPTKGHAQKVLAPTKALGAIVGKALAPLKKGKGKIPVLVMLQ